MTANDVFIAIGGRPRAAALFGVSAQAIWNMVARGSIPSTYWPKIVEASKGKVTYEHLASMQIAAAPEREAS